MEQRQKSWIKNELKIEDRKHWFLDYQQQALSQLATLEAPQIERFNYQDWQLFAKPEAVKEMARESSFQKEDRLADADFVQLSSGRLERNQKEDAKIEVYSFRELFESNHQGFKERYLKSEYLHFSDQFNLFNLAYLSSGIFIYIPKGVQIQNPVHFSFFNEKSELENTNHQVFIYAEENSAVELVESYYSFGDSKQKSKMNLHVHIQSQAGSNIKYTAIDALDENTQAFFRRTAQTERDASLEIALGMMSDGDMITDTQVDLIGEGSTVDIKVVAISHHQQSQVVNSKVINHGANTIGNIYQHGVVLNQARLTFNGLGDVLKKAKNSDAQQESRILMLSEDARADTNPMLLIDEYELTAGHAASISRVDEEQLYYLMSRGLGRVEAEKLVIRGFLGTVLSALSVEEVRKDFITTIERKLSDL